MSSAYSTCYRKGHWSTDHLANSFLKLGTPAIETIATDPKPSGDKPQRGCTITFTMDALPAEKEFIFKNDFIVPLLDDGATYSWYRFLLRKIVFRKFCFCPWIKISSLFRTTLPIIHFGNMAQVLKPYLCDGLLAPCCSLCDQLMKSLRIFVIFLCLEFLSGSLDATSLVIAICNILTVINFFYWQPPMLFLLIVFLLPPAIFTVTFVTNDLLCMTHTVLQHIR